ncbi:MAG: hypothetical protein JXR40_01425 [Pontiellaceae bacterium]|nr:hypothetical protein [Pontiellaceae bacterium]
MNLSKKILQGLFFGALLAASTAISDEKIERQPAAVSLSDGAVSVPDRSCFELLAHRDDVPGALGVLEIKFLIMDVDSAQPRLYFINSKNHFYHYDFAHDVLGFEFDMNAFNHETYFNDRFRKNVAGSILAHDHFVEKSGESETLYTMEFWPSDPVGFLFVQAAYQCIYDAMPFARDRLRYHPNGETHEKLFKKELAEYSNSKIQTISTEQLFENMNYSPLNLGQAYGRLKRANSDTQLAMKDIVIFQTVPNDLTHVAGIITEIPQTPLSHINLKAKQNKTPNAYIRDASNHPDLAPLIGQNVQFKLSADGFSVVPATQAKVDAFFAEQRPSKRQEPSRNLTPTQPAVLNDIGRIDAEAFGSKSANVAELRKLIDGFLKVPDGVAIPFSMYDTFMQSNGLYIAAATMMCDPAFKTNETVRAEALKDFRDRIRAAYLLPDQMRLLSDVQSKFPPDTRIRCRSSANVEDLEGFNGAGLYDSKTHKPSEGHLSKTIKQVWASNWTFRAFEEREFYRIDHLKSAMGVLCHPSYRDEQANGVAVTKNLFNPDWRGYYVNVQAGESLVTNPDEGAVPDEFLISAIEGENEYEIQYVRQSNQIPSGSHVLTREQAVLLAEELERVQKHFLRVYAPLNSTDFAMEVEFKITAEGDLVFKQARPWVD